MKATSDASEPDQDSVLCRRPSAASKSDDDTKEASDGGDKTVRGRLEADGASVHSSVTDKANSSGVGHQLGEDVASSQGTGATMYIVVVAFDGFCCIILISNYVVDVRL